MAVSEGPKITRWSSGWSSKLDFRVDGGDGGIEPGERKAVFARARSSNVHPLQKQCLGTALLDRQLALFDTQQAANRFLMGAEAAYPDRSCNLLLKERKVEAEGR